MNKWGIYLKKRDKQHPMKHKRLAILTYWLDILFLLLILFLQRPEYQLLALALLFANQAGRIILLAYEKWNWTHKIAISHLILITLFALLFLTTRVTGVSYIYGGVLILASFIFLILELSAGWRSVNIIDRFLRKDDELVVELGAKKKDEIFVAKQGSKTYHLRSCRTLKKRDKLVELSANEAKAYSLRPCKVCKPLSKKKKV